MRTFFNHTKSLFAALTLVTYAPLATVGCAQQDVAAERNLAPSGGQLEIAGTSGTQSVDIPESDLEQVRSNAVVLVADGKETTDLGAVLEAQEVHLKGGGGFKLVRQGNSLLVEGSQSLASVEVKGRDFAVTTPNGQWRCRLKGLDSADTAQLAGQMSMSILFALESEARGEEGRCEVACILLFSVVGAAIITVALLYLHCEINGAKICADNAVRACGKGKVKSSKKNCGAILSGNFTEKNGKVNVKGGCDNECK